MKNYVSALALCLLGATAFGQADSIAKAPKKGSYLFFGQPAIEDNSMLIEEAFNQESGVIQHISNLIVDQGNVLYAYTQEIPLANDRHQLSFTVAYNSFKKTTETESRFKRQGFGDILINYRPMIWGKNDWALVIPRFTLVIPTGDARNDFGSGAWGYQFNLAVTKRLSKTITTHYNAGYNWLSGANYYPTTAQDLLIRKDLSGFNVGGSVIWSVTPKFNLMTEFVENFQDEFAETGAVDKKYVSYVINPGFRFAFETNKMQIVPGAGFPLNFADGRFQNRGVFFYLSIEPAF
jgi:hypothetical protein